LDHILGLPFFAPIYVRGNHLKIYGPLTFEEDSLAEVIGGQLSYRYFPVRQEELGATIEYINLKEGHYDLGDGILMTAKYLNHPLLSLGYRFEYRGSIICTAFDTEPFYNVFTTDSLDPNYDEILAFEGEAAAHEENLRMEEFVSAADLLIHDGQFTLAEYKSGKQGWGHSPMEHVIEVAQRVQVKRLALCHHDPIRTDAQIDELSESLCRPAFDGDTEVFFAREGRAVPVN
jgi:ribonuclease BN (tRNA processing enzyme)